ATSSRLSTTQLEMGKRKGGKGRSAKAAQAGDRGEGQLRVNFSGKFANRAEKRARLKEEKDEVKKLRDQVAVQTVSKDKAKEPHSIVIPSGEVGKFVKRLVRDYRKVMEPNTAMKLKVMKRNNIRDFVTTGAVLGVTHMMVFTRSEMSVNMRLMRFPQGPTLTFRVKEYTLMRDVLSSLKKVMVFDELYKSAPLVILSGFKEGQARHLALVQTTFQNMFPSINVDMVNLASIRRCVMVRYNEEDDTFDIRHYSIKTVPTGMSKSTKKLLQSKLPDLSRYKDISEYFENPGHLSDSEMEEESKNVELAQDLGRGCKKGGQTQIRLLELGPRLTVELIKVEQEIDEGEVLYHKHVTKSAAEIEELKKKAPRVKKMRERRRKDIEMRVIRKLERAEDQKKEEEEEQRQIREAAARKQAMATGQTEEVETDYARDREIAAQRERDEGRLGGGEGQNEAPPYKRRRMGRENGEGAAGERGEERRTLKKSSSVKVAMKKFSKGRGGGRR
ncbi:lpd-6, partial [Pristionchus pacificus]